MASADPVIQTIEGRRTLVVTNEHGLPRSLEELLRQMQSFGFTHKADPVLGGARTACESLRTHRFARFREGRWFTPRDLVIRGGAAPDAQRTIPAGVLELALSMCQDCGAVCVRDVSSEMWAGARPARLVNLRTGDERLAPAIGRRNVVLGWYSGARRNGREYR
jgi:hypothetical protein